MRTTEVVRRRPYALGQVNADDRAGTGLNQGDKADAAIPWILVAARHLLGTGRIDYALYRVA